MQVVRELKRAGYKPKMAILVSPSATISRMKAAENIAQACCQAAVAVGAHRIDMPAKGQVRFADESNGNGAASLLT